MKRIVGLVDIAAFIILGAIFMSLVLVILTASSMSGRRRRKTGEVNELSYAIFDLIGNKYSSMYEDALLNGYISRHYYIYIDYDRPADRFENMKDRIFFHSLAAHPGRALYRAGFSKLNMLAVEIRSILRGVGIALKGNIGFVKSHDPHMLGLNALIIARLFRIPCVLHMNSDFDMKYRGTGNVSNPLFITRGFERLFERAIIASYDIIMADRSLYSKSRSFPRACLDKYRAFGVRVDGKHYTEPSARRDLRRELGLGSRKSLLYVGRLHPVKYPEDALSAFGILKSKMKDVALIIVGAGVLRQRLERMAKDGGFAEDVLFLGTKRYEELIDILSTADVLIAPHGGVTLVEAALAATPVVAYDFDWHPEFMEEGKMGYLVPFRDIGMLAKKAGEILADEALRRRMGQYCRSAAMERYSRNASMENERKIYESLLKA